MGASFAFGMRSERAIAASAQQKKGPPEAGSGPEAHNRDR
jgi:hypothetical protein